MNKLNLSYLFDEPEISIDNNIFFKLNLSMKSIIFFDKWREKFTEEELSETNLIPYEDKQDILNNIVKDNKQNTFFFEFNKIQNKEIQNNIFDKTILFWIKKALPIMEIEKNLVINKKKD